MGPADLANVLTRSGIVTDPRITAAVAAVRREIFVPGHPLDQVYGDNALVTHEDARGMPISSSSQPAIVVIMLEQLAAGPGQQVLEVGAGTGYNAALLAALGASVVTVDIDEGIAAEARAHLAAAGISGVDVRTGDGWLGWPDGAPYDRIELTVGAWDLSRAWRDQLTDSGVLVVPLWLRAGVQLSVAFRRDGDVLRSGSVRYCGFMRLRGPHAGPEGHVPVGDGVYAMLDDTSAATVSLLHGLLATEPGTYPLPAVSPAVKNRIALDQPRTVGLGELHAGGSFQAGLYETAQTGGPSLAVLGDGGLLSYGSPAARDRLLGALAAARPLDLASLRVTAYFEDFPCRTGAGWRLTRPSCVLDVAQP
jgi:protein-L-isoaspartate(D-aspartate) O-methyltransferase